MISNGDPFAILTERRRRHASSTKMRSILCISDPGPSDPRPSKFGPILRLRGEGDADFRFEQQAFAEIERAGDTVHARKDVEGPFGLWDFEEGRSRDCASGDRPFQ